MKMDLQIQPSIKLREPYALKGASTVLTESRCIIMPFRHWYGGLSSYDEVNLSEVIITVTPIEKTKKEGEGKGNKYFIAEFSYQVLSNEDRNAIKLLGESLKVWRADTLTHNSTLELSVNYNPPILIIEQNTQEEMIPELGEVAPKNEK